MGADGVASDVLAFLKLPASIRVQLNERAATTPWVGKPGLGGGFADELRNFSASTACLKSAFNIPVQWLLARLAGLKAEYT